MDRDRWSRIKALLPAALERPPGERAPFLGRDEPDAAIRTEVQRLLDADPGAAEA